MNADRLINLTAEAALLGAMMLDNRLIVQVADRVKQDDFGDALHGRIFTSALKFAAKGLRADAMTLRPLFHHDQDAQYGEYLDQLVESPAVVDAAGAIADQVADLAARRHARDVMRSALGALEDDLDRDVGEICSQVESAGWEASQGGEDDLASNAGDLVGLVEERDDRICANAQAAGISNRLIEDIDLGLGLLESGTYNLVAGRPGMGKTALASSAGLGYAMNGHAGIFLEYEMTKEQLGLRVSADCGHALGYRLPHANLRKGGLSREQRLDLADIRKKVASLPIRFLTPKSSDIRRLWSLVSRQKALWAAAGRKLEWVIIDQLTLITATDEAGRPIEDDRKRMSYVSKMAKRMAKELDVVVIALTQLSRGVESRLSKRPMLSDLKESGSLEEDADTVTLLFREEVYLKQNEPKRGEKDKGGHDLHEEWEAEMHAAFGKMDMIFAKNRHGNSTTRTARFLGEFSSVRSSDFDPYSDQPVML